VEEPKLTDVAPGVTRLLWEADLQDRDVEAAAPVVRNAVERAFKGGARRVETHLDPDDTSAHRIATRSGLMREGVARGMEDGNDRVVYARVAEDAPLEEPSSFRQLRNSFLPRKRAIGQLLVRDHDGRVLLCQLTYKRDWDLPGGVVEVGESPQQGALREIREELDVSLPAGRLVLTDWLPPWSGWDDAVCLVFDGGVHDASLIEQMTYERREIRSVRFCDLDEVHELCADFTARRTVAALRALDGQGPSYTESGRTTG
jgi:8-oxo-dGTP pyrophosphatase MutT (NUDIX family)